jgi:predicted porin
MWPLLFDLALVSSAQKVPPPDPPWLNEIAQRVDVYGRFDGYLAVTRESVEIHNNSSRFGIKAEQELIGGLFALGQGEWRMSLGQGDTTYAVSENPDTGFATLESTTRQALETRLGFVGLRFREFGKLLLGKQWGVYYDVSEWTDRFVVFGAHGSSTYNAGTDGGQTGEGRANDALTYRVGIGPFAVGLQAQFLDSRREVVDGLSGSLVGQLGRGLRAGVTYSHSFMDLGTGIAGYDGGDAQALTGGVTFDGADWTASALGTWTHNHEAVTTAAATVMYGTLGAELFVARRFRDLFLFYCGFDLAIPRDLDARFVDPDYGTRDLLGGVRWLFDSSATSFVYLEGRAGQSRDKGGGQAGDVVTLGLRFNYSLRRGLGLSPLR